ncbi:MAG: hypothetical protein ABMB14_29845 [Myxococcota bacterium]
MWFVTSMVAWGAPKPASEEVTVYGDDFARWDRTRWFVQDQMVLPSGIALASDENRSFRSHALQVRAIVACDKDAKLTGHRWEVSCAIEDIGILATTADGWAPGPQARVQQVLDEIDARLGDSKVQMQVTDVGAITDFDVEGVRSDNLRERQIQETFRTIVSQLMAGFHLQIPDHAQRTGQWLENHTELMDIPSLTAARGSTTVVHQTSDWKGNRLVQTAGKGMVAVAIPYRGDDPFNQSMLIAADGGDSTAQNLANGPIGEAGREAVLHPALPEALAQKAVRFPPPEDSAPTESSLTGPARAGEEQETALESMWEMELSGVAVFEKATGVMTERVWLCSGTPTAGSAGGSATTGPYLNVGRLYRLSPTDAPSVGPTAQVAWPGQEMAGLDPWVDLESR